MKTITIPAGPEALTAEWLTEALRSTGVIRAAAVTAITPEVVGEGSGFIGQLARVGLEYDRAEAGAPASLIAKFPASSQAGREIGMLFRFYEREIRFYQEIADEVELRTPRLLYSAMDVDRAEFILLLEDLAPGRIGDHAAGISLADAELAVRSIAKFHAAWWQSPRLEQLAAWMPVIDAPVHRSAEQSYQQAWGPFTENLDLFAQGVPLTPEMLALAERLQHNVVNLQSSFADRPWTIVHADYRPDNFVFATPQGGPEFAVFDWQISCMGRGIFDIAYLLCGALDPEPRKANERRLLQAYHDILVADGVQGYSFQQCWEEYRRASLYVLVYVVISLGTLDPANERGLALMRAWLRRTTSAIADLNAGELMPA